MDDEKQNCKRGKRDLIDQLYQTKPNGPSQTILLDDPYLFPTELMD
jgi:hypothetical protein